MNEQIKKSLERSRYRVLTGSQDLEKIYRLRYKCYLAEEAIDSNIDETMTDAFDESENCVHVAVEMEEETLASVRLHLVSEHSLTSPTLEVFPELQAEIGHGCTILDPTRFVIDPRARKQRLQLHFLVLRIPFLATIFYDVDLALAPVRAEHAAFYRRYLGYSSVMKPRHYPGLKKPIQLLTAKVREQRDKVLLQTPVLGPVESIAHANIDFPTLAGVYPNLKKHRFDAA